MIKKLKIKNFRNLSELTLDFNNMTSIISGKNELGKSNALNALNWLLTGTILTDKWGTGENDIDSIVPNNATRGINPEVTIELSTGTEFTKKYVSKWSKDGLKVTGHTTEWLINGVACKNETEFNESLYPVIKYSPTLKTKEISELRLFIDPLYALQKLDAKALRALLVDLGCSVSNEEMYQLGYEDLRAYGDKYLGKWDVCRKALKDDIKVLTKEIESLQAKLETVAAVDENFDSRDLDLLNKELESLISKKANINANNINPEINELEKQIAVLNNTIQTKIANHNNNISNKKAALLMKRQTTLDKLNHEASIKLNPIQDEIGKTRMRIDELNNSIRAYTITINQNQSLMKSYVDLANKMNADKANLSIKLDIARNAKYSNFIVCPICGSEFAANEEEKAQFEAHNQEEINKLIAGIEECEKKKQEYKVKYEESKKLKDDAFNAKDHADGELLELNNKIQQLESEIINTQSTPIDMTEINAIDLELSQLNTPVDISVENIQLNELKAKIEAIKSKSQSTIQDEINAIDLEIGDINNKISNEYVKRSKANEKELYINSLSDNQKQLNNSESLLARVNDFIQKMISMINEKATEKTGLKFVMLEENLSNDGIKEVCYATVDDIPFKDVNTAKKLKYGIKFIEKLKELLGHNELPILADRMEGIDSLDTIKNLTQEQLICTRVTNGGLITIE